jgi:hypothetical protein
MKKKVVLWELPEKVSGTIVPDDTGGLVIVLNSALTRDKQDEALCYFESVLSVYREG